MLSAGICLGDDGTPVSSRTRAILLPVDFTVYELNAAGREAVPDWTASARDNITQQLEQQLAQRANLQLVALPELNPDERAVLDEYVSVAKLIALQGNELKRGDWKSRRPEFDRHLGEALHFLADRADAEYLILVHGTQTKRSGGLMFAQVIGAAAGFVPTTVGGTSLSTTLVALRPGEVAWFNVASGAEEFAGMGTDLRDPVSAAKILGRLIEPYPLIPALEDRK